MNPNMSSMRKSLLFLLLLLNLHLIDLCAQAYQLEHYEVEENNRVLNYPYLGGLNNPQFIPMDIDLNGIDEYVIFDRDGEVFLPFLELGASGVDNVIYAPEYASIFPEIGHWVRSRDANGDGLRDLFVASLIGIPGAQLFKAVVINDSLAFELVNIEQDYFNVLAYETSGGNLSNLEVTDVDIPAIDDIDFDGDMDFLSFSSDRGTVNFYRSLMIERGLPLTNIVFKLETNCWGDFYESDSSSDIDLSPTPGECAQNAQSGDTRHHAGSTLEIFDPDKDSLVDVLIGDLSSSTISALYNSGSINQAHMSSQDNTFPAYDVSAEVNEFVSSFHLDINNDGKKDLVFSPNLGLATASTFENVSLYLNTGTNKDSFVLTTTNFLGEDCIDHGLKSIPAVGDINGDGLMDILLGVGRDFSVPGLYNRSLISYINHGSSSEPHFVLDQLDFGGLAQFADLSRAFAPTLFDIDADNDIDLIVGDGDGKLFFLENSAGAGNPMVLAPPVYEWMGIDVGEFAVPCFYDLDDDGLSDLIIGERNGNNVMGQRCGNINYFQNLGTEEDPFFNEDPDNPCLGEILTFDSFQITGYSAPFVYDGEQNDIFITGSQTGTIRWHEIQHPDSVFPHLDLNLGKMDDGTRSHCVIVQLDGDNKLEFVCGNQRGGLTIYESIFFEDGSNPVSNMNAAIPDLRIYPNPVTSGHEVRLTWGVEHETAQLEIFNLEGKCLHRNATYINGEVLGTTVLGKGVFIIQLKSESGTGSIKLLIN